MARAGITKQQVKEAILALESQNVAVTIDAVRVELGNTGSKTTISRFMTELADEKAVQMDKESYVGDKLMALVGELAKGLNDDAKAIVEQAESRHKTALSILEQRNQSLHEELTNTQDHVAQLLATISEMEKRAEVLDAKNRELEIQTEKSAEREISLQTQLTLKDQQLASLEDKHQHARESLAHYRESVQTQRAQEQTRHESQIQQITSELRNSQSLLSVKQEEISQLNKELSSEKALKEALTSQLHGVERTCKDVQLQLDNVRRDNESLNNALLHKNDINNALSKQVTELELRQSESTRAFSLLEKQSVSLQTELETKNSLYTQLLQGLEKFNLPSKLSATPTANN